MARRSAETDKPGSLDKQLKDMFRTLLGRPMPDRIRSVVEQLDTPADERLKKSG